MIYLLYVLAGYLLGSIPTAVWVGRRFYDTDVREHGSKNAGATNTFRVLGKKPGIIVLSIDIIKGFIASCLPLWLGSAGEDALLATDLQLCASLACVLGHVFPLFANFKGGKGVATSLGVIIGLHPLAAFSALGGFMVVYLAFSFVSLGAITAAVLFPLLLIFMFDEKSTNLMIFSISLSVAVILAHRKNIKRLLKGEESKMALIKKRTPKEEPN